MPRINISNLIIFGDSMSDIGNKRSTGMGRFARMLGLMRTNEVGRYSDGRNWTDFLWEWAGARSLIHTDKNTSNADTAVHLSLSRDSSQDSGFGRPITYSNYAEGGAMGASDRPATGLGVYKDQVLRYLKQRQAFPLTGNVMHIIWFGLNDLVTNERKPDDMGRVVDELGVGMRAIKDDYGVGTYFMVINLPSPASAVRMLKANDLKVVAALDKGALVFNAAMTSLTDGKYYKNADNEVMLVDMYNWVEAVNANPAKYHLESDAQPHGVPVNYGTLADTTAYRQRVATSDNAHPTEAVYKLIARCIAREMVTKFEMGRLSRCLACRDVPEPD